MKRLFASFLVLFACLSASSQTLQEMYDQKVRIIDSLQQALNQAIASNENYTAQAQRSLLNLKDSVKSLKAEYAGLEKFKSEKKAIDAQLKAKSDSINDLKEKYSEEKTNGSQRASDEYAKGKQQALDDIIRAYKQPFDELVKSSSKQSVQRDLRLIGNNQAIEQTLNDLKKYFSAKELLSKQYDDFSIQAAQRELKQIKENFSALEKLKSSVDNYQIFNDGLKETIVKLADLDSKETGEGMGDVIQKQKFNKILAEISSYIFNYDFNFKDYPYLSDIVLEIIKRKQPNPDADISDLLNKLQ